MECDIQNLVEGKTFTPRKRNQMAFFKNKRKGLSSIRLIWQHNPLQSDAERVEGAPFRQGGEGFPPTCVNASHKTSKLVRQISIESSFMKNFSHGNNHTRRRRLRKENTLKTRTSLQKKLARSGSARAVEETMPL